MSIGEIIKNRRENIGMSQKELALAIGVSAPMICQIERGSKVPSMILGNDIARILKCTLDDLVSNKETSDV